MLNKNNDIESLRAVAILFVLVLHLNMLLVAPLSPFTWLREHYDLGIGVDLFFVISGYVITNSLYDLEIQPGQARWRLVATFWIRRFFRLAPTAFLWLFIAAVLVILRASISESFDVGKPEAMAFLAGILNVQNVYDAYCIRSPAASICGAYYIHGHYWSLSLEEQFYLVIPILFFFLNRRLLVVLLISTILVLLTVKRPYWSYGWFFRIDGFCWGILLSILHKQFSFPIARSIFANKIIRGVSLIALCALLPYVSHSVQGWGKAATTYGVGVVAMLCAAIVGVATFAPQGEGGGRLGLSRILVLIGARSYSLYVIHLIVFLAGGALWVRLPIFTAITAHNGVMSTLILMTTCVLLTLFATELNYRFIETRLRRVGRRISDNFMSKCTSTDHVSLVATEVV